MEPIINDGYLVSQSDYQVKVKYFENGRIEACLKVVKPLVQDMMHAASNYPAAYRPLRVGLAKTPEELEEAKEANRARAAQRAKQAVRHLCMAFDADRLLTLTYRENQEDRALFYKHFTKFLRLVRKSYPEFASVAVPELQDRGAWHMHLAIKGWVRISIIRQCWYKALGGTGKEEGDQTPGQVNIQGPKGRASVNRTWKATKLAAYISKYISKSFEDVETGLHRYFASRNLPKVPPSFRFWITGQNMAQAAFNLVRDLERRYDLHPDFGMYLSDDETCFWLNGRNACT